MLTELQPAFILHTRAYRDTSLLIDMFTREHGKITLVGKGVKNKKKRDATLLQPFASLLISFWMRGELGALRNCELHSQPFWLTGKRLVSGLYLNELLNRLLAKHIGYVELFDYYAMIIQKIATVEMTEIPATLRLFEKFLINELGYGLVFDHDAHTGNAIEPDAYYALDPATGCYKMNVSRQDYIEKNLFKGSSILALHHGRFSEAEQLHDAKRLMRYVLTPHLGGKPVYSRALWG